MANAFCAAAAAVPEPTAPRNRLKIYSSATGPVNIRTGSSCPASQDAPAASDLTPSRYVRSCLGAAANLAIISVGSDAPGSRWRSLPIRRILEPTEPVKLNVLSWGMTRRIAPSSTGPRRLVLTTSLFATVSTSSRTGLPSIVRIALVVELVPAWVIRYALSFSAL